MIITRELAGSNTVGRKGYSMGHPRFSGEEIARRGEEWYERSIRPQVKIEGYIGKILSIDIETGDFELGEDPVITGRRLQARHPGAAIWTKRVGYDAVYAIGGTRTRVDS